MSFAGLLTVPCELIKRSQGPADEYNDPTLLEVRTASLCWYEVKRSRELSDSGLVEVAFVTVFLPPDAGLGAIDAVQITGGPLVESDGIPHPAINARTGRLHHLELVGREVA